MICNKRKSRAFGKNIYLLGIDEYNTYYWLEEASWDCNWYWGFGYVETYTNNRNPERAKDISSHQHFDGLFLEKGRCAYDVFKEFLVTTTLADDEIWKLLELMQSFYTARRYAEMVYRGGSHFTKNPCSLTIKNEEEYTRINQIVIPTICKEVYKLLGEDAE